MTTSLALQFPCPAVARLAVAASLAASLAACGGGGDSNAGGFTLGGTVTGLAEGRSIVLQNNQGDDLSITGNGRFTFVKPLAQGSAYAVRVPSQPAGQTCYVANGNGTVADAHVGSVQVACAAAVWGLPQGDWAVERCIPLDVPKGTRGLWRITRQDDSVLTVTLGLMAYATPECSGPGIAQSEQTYARFELERKETRGTITAFWGQWTFNVTPDRTTRAVLARSGPYLCWGVDHAWARFPTMDEVESLVNSSMQSGHCYLPMP